MPDTAKYLIHARISADGVVERNDVVGAVFGQTEGLLGDDLDLRDLQESSKVGRIDVEIDSEGGQSFGHLTIATSLDKVETAILAAGLETIDRVGPCRADLEVTSIEDVRAAKRREVVDRAKELLGEAFEGSMMTSQELVEEVRRSIRVEDMAEFEGLPAGPNVGGSDAVIVVEGRADVAQLLGYGIKNAVAVEGTNVPEEVADLTRHKTVTAFLDGDRGGDLILKELVQVGEVDYVAFAPEGQSVEDLSRHEVMAALRDKVPYETIADREAGAHEVAATDGSSRPAPDANDGAGTAPTPETPETPPTPRSPAPGTATETTPEAGPAVDPRADAGDVSAAAEPAEPEEPPSTDEPDAAAVPDAGEAEGDDGDATDADDEDAGDDGDAEPETLRGHVRATVDTGEVRLLDGEMAALAVAPADEAFDRVEAAEPVPTVVVLDGELSQRLLDICAQRGVDQVVAASLGELVKRPTGVRVRTLSDLLEVADE
ncbi:DNA primase DnaG [Haloglomus litoreum]|uniref:DNA primase DnaG n=1 Tax=Haloglomus litoreum TaxID=3034026 RepID=UPI0023E83A61|nr:DNA primase DnaG [Haloglomus sp. DT116]